MIKKVGPKQRHIKIPNGWRILEKQEIMNEGDMVANIYTAIFENIDAVDVGLKAEIYDLVIRKNK